MLSIKIKRYEFARGNEIFTKAKKLWDTRKENNFESDGLIFTPILEHYQKRGGSWFSLFKWKPAELNSIDFLIKIVKNDDDKMK